MGRIVRLITLPFRLVFGLALGLWGVCYALWVMARTGWAARGMPAQDDVVLDAEDFEDPEPETTEPLSRSLDMVMESMDEIRIVPTTPFVPWWKRPGAKPRGN